MSNKDKEIEKLNKEIEVLKLEKEVLELQKEIEELKKEQPDKFQIPEIIRIPIVIPECPPKPCPRVDPCPPYDPYPYRPGEPIWVWDPNLAPQYDISEEHTTSDPIRYNESRTSDKIPEQPRYTCDSGKVNYKCGL